MLFISCQNEAHRIEKDHSLITDTLDRFNSFLNNSNIDSLGTLFSEQAIVSGPGYEKYEGAVEAGSFFELWLSTRNLKVEIAADSVLISKSFATAYGNMSGIIEDMENGMESSYHSDFVAILKPELENWKVYHLIWNEKD